MRLLKNGTKKPKPDLTPHLTGFQNLLGFRVHMPDRVKTFQVSSQYNLPLILKISVLFLG